jgi:prophage maintenance system killer protein
MTDTRCCPNWDTHVRMLKYLDGLDSTKAIRTDWLPSSDWDSAIVLDLPSVAPEIRAEYLRWVEIVGEDDPYAGPNALGIHDVLKAHFLIADFFFAAGEGLGGLGPRDPTLLHSALYRQHIAFQGSSKWDNHYDIAATLLFGLIKDHPFHDANKRTAFLSTIYYLFRRGCIPKIHQSYFEEFTVEIADDKLRKYARYIALLKHPMILKLSSLPIGCGLTHERWTKDTILSPIPT